jgi:hypothetical protein
MSEPSTEEFKPKSNLYYFDKKSKEYKSRIDSIRRNLRFLPKATNSNKSQSKTGRSLISNYLDLIEKSKNGIVFVRHDFISSITETSRRQNNNLHKEISNLFDITYHHSVVVNGEQKFSGMTIELLEEAREIIENPEKFYSLDGKKITHKKKIIEKTGNELPVDGKLLPSKRKLLPVDGKKITQQKEKNYPLLYM